MTQKRGLGRGLGALIPGAGSAPAPEQELRTRSTVRTRSDQEEQSVSERPVDMFFSGEEISEEARRQRDRGPRQDLAGDMARDAAKRRGRGTTSSGAQTGKNRTSRSATSGETGSAGEAAAGTESTPARTTPTKRSSTTSTTAKSTARSSSGSKRTATKGTASKSTSSKGSTAKSSGSSGSKRRADRSTMPQSTGAKSTAAKSAETKSSADKSTAARSAETEKTGARSTATAKDAPTRAPSTNPEQTTSRSSTVAPTAPNSAAASDAQAPARSTSSSEAPTAENSPVVDVETVDPIPAREDDSVAAGADREALSASEASAPEGALTAEQGGEAVAAEPTAEVARTAPSDGIDPATSEAGEHQDPAQTTVPEESAETESAETMAPSEGRPAAGSGAGARTDEASSHEGLMAVPGAEFAEIPIHEIRENPRNPRTMFDEDELDELAFSVRQVGILQPVVVRPIPATEDGESFELVMGERRWRAARRAGLSSIPSIIRETSEDDLLRDALLENLHRTQLNPLEEAAAYQQLLDDFGCTQDELGERIGRSRPQITNTLRLLRLPALVQRRLASGALSAGHARALLGLDDPALMEELAQRIVSEGLSVRAVERLVAGGPQPTTTRSPRRSTYDPHVVDLTSRLSNRLETQVRIDVGKRKGRITMEFTNLEDLERLVENIGLDLRSDAAEDHQS